MKTKLTLTVDKNLLPQAKLFARHRGHSLSELVEGALKEMAQAGEPRFSKRWRGKFKASRRDSVRYKTLAKRYL